MDGQKKALPEFIFFLEHPSSPLPDGPKRRGGEGGGGTSQTQMLMEYTAWPTWGQKGVGTLIGLQTLQGGITKLGITTLPLRKHPFCDMFSPKHPPGCLGNMEK